MKDEGPNPGIQQGTKYLATGMRFGGAIVLFLLGGYAVDRWLHTAPLFLLVGMFVGAVLGFVSVWRELKADPANRPTWRGGRADKADKADRRTGGRKK